MLRMTIMNSKAQLTVNTIAKVAVGSAENGIGTVGFMTSNASTIANLSFDTGDLLPKSASVITKITMLCISCHKTKYVIV